MPALTIPNTNSVSSGSNYHVTSKNHHYAVSSSEKIRSNSASKQQYNHSMIPSHSSVTTGSSPMEHNNNIVNTTTPSPGSLRVDTRQMAMIHLRSSSSAANGPTKSGTATKSTNNVLASSTSGTRAARLKNALSPTSTNTETIEDIQYKLKQNLTRYTQAGDRRMVCRTLQNCGILKNIVFDRNTAVAAKIPPINELEKLASTAPVEFNGMVLGGGKFDNNNNNNPNTGSVGGGSIASATTTTSVVQRGWNDLNEIPSVLREVCSRLVRNPEVNNGPSEHALYVAVLVRISKLQSSQDSHAQLTEFLACPPDLNVHVPKKPWKPLGRTQVWLYASDGYIHFHCKSHHAYGLFRKSDTVNRPWIGLTATVHERINLTTGASVDRITVDVHEDKYSL